MKILDLNGVKVPALGFGTWNLSGATCRRMVDHALGLGYRHIDTATIYGNEVEVGQGIRDSGVPRGDIFLTTKVWSSSLAADAVKASAEESLRALGTDYVDLLLIHWPNPSVPLAETLGALADVRARGLTRRIGVSNFPVVLMEETVETLGADILANQVEYHPYLSQNRVLAYCRAHGITLTAYSPVARGRVNTDPVLADIGARHGKTPAQVALRWLIEQDNVSIIPKAAKPEHARDNLDIFDFELSAGDRAAIDALPKNVRITDILRGWSWDSD